MWVRKLTFVPWALQRGNWFSSSLTLFLSSLQSEGTQTGRVPEYLWAGGRWVISICFLSALLLSHCHSLRTLFSIFYRQANFTLNHWLRCFGAVFCYPFLKTGLILYFAGHWWASIHDADTTNGARTLKSKTRSSSEVVPPYPKAETGFLRKIRGLPCLLDVLRPLRQDRHIAL